MNQNLTHISIVLDRSGSMAAVQDATIQGFNEFVEGQRKAPGEATISLIQFDTDNPFEVVYDRRPVGEVPKLDAGTYRPRGGTPLHDAIGKTINSMGSHFKTLKESERPSKVVVAIMTDGLENASREFKGSQIAEMIKHQHEVYKWEFLFLGANQDAILTGEALNIPAMNAVTYAHTTSGTMSAMASTSYNVAMYRGSGFADQLAYSTEQREEAEGKVPRRRKPASPGA